MNRKYRGSCHCGAVVYEISSKPIGVGNCHCRACQKATGAAYFTEALFNKAFVTLRGQLVEHRSTADSGANSYRGFCAKCGSIVTGYSDDSPNIAIAVSTLDDAGEFVPQMDIYTSAAQPWVQMDPDIPKFKGKPPP